MHLWTATVALCAVFYCGAIVYRPAPVHARPAASWLKTDKVQDRLPVRAVPTIAYRIDPPVVAALTTEPGLPWPCETVRNAVANLTPEQVARLARVYRLTDQQRAAARRCLKEKRT